MTREEFRERLLIHFIQGTNLDRAPGEKRLKVISERIDMIVEAFHSHLDKGIEKPKPLVRTRAEIEDEVRNIDTTNRFLVTLVREDVFVGAFERGMTKSAALNLAAWLVAMADDKQEFQDILEAVLNVLPRKTMEESRCPALSIFNRWGQVVTLCSMAIGPLHTYRSYTGFLYMSRDCYDTHWIYKDGYLQRKCRHDDGTDGEDARFLPVKYCHA